MPEQEAAQRRFRRPVAEKGEGLDGNGEVEGLTVGRNAQQQTAPLHGERGDEGAQCHCSQPPEGEHAPAVGGAPLHLLHAQPPGLKDEHHGDDHQAEGEDKGAVVI